MIAAVLVVLIAIFGGASAEIEQRGSVVYTKYGPIKGIVTEKFRRFQGVPFATPPLGKLRFMNPIPPTPWSTIKDCTNFTIGCAQTAHGMDVPKNTSEDCLYLEVWTPTLGAYSEPAAVMIFFYGGDFKEGGESFELYNGSYIASTTNTIVVITDYRIGVLGFLYTGFTDPNPGLEDQRATIRWVNENIAYFGGNPNNVMIFGESAGGESILIHMSNPLVPESKMFHKALVESGPMSLNFRGPMDALALGQIFLYELGCQFGDLKCVQSKNTSEILNAGKKAIIIPSDWSEAIMEWSPVWTGGEEFPLEPLEAFQRGQIVKVPFAIGSNLQDGVLFSWAISPNQPMPDFEYSGIVAGIFLNFEQAQQILNMYPPVKGGDNRQIASEMINDYVFLCDSRKTARLAQSAGINNTYYYQFTKVPPVCPWPKSQQYCCDKVCHGDELPYVFRDNGNPYPWNFTGGDLSLANSMATYWANFAHSGNPNTPYTQPGSITWPLYQEQTDQSIDFNWPLTVKTGLNKAKCDFWDTIGYYHQSKVKKVMKDYAAKKNKINFSL